MSNMSDLTFIKHSHEFGPHLHVWYRGTVRAVCDVLEIVQIFVLEIYAIILMVLSTAQTYTAYFRFM